jgi:hypothetical protein
MTRGTEIDQLPRAGLSLAKVRRVEGPSGDPAHHVAVQGGSTVGLQKQRRLQ